MISKPFSNRCFPLLLPTFFLLTCIQLTGRLHAQEHFPSPVEIGYRDFSYGVNIYRKPTAEKPEHKLWIVEDVWYGSLWDTLSTSYAIYKFNSGFQSWKNTGTAIDERPNSLADALWDGKKLYIASHMRTQPGAARLYRYSYDRKTKAFRADEGFPVKINDNASETLTIAKDGKGVLWAVWTENGRVMLNNSQNEDKNWGAPFRLPAASADASRDDIAAITAFDGGKIGVMWSNQNEKVVFFAAHLSGSPRTVWQKQEIAFSLPAGEFAADDHINLKTSRRGGDLFAAVKTSLFENGAPSILLLHRSAAGKWQRHEVWKFEATMTRPLLVLDDENRMLHVLAVCRKCGEGAVYRKSSRIERIVFPEGRGTLFMESASASLLNDLTSTRQPLDGATDMLVLASDASSRYYLHNYLDLPSKHRPRKPFALNAEAQNCIMVKLSWQNGADNESGYRIERKESGGKFLQIADLNPPKTRFSDAGLHEKTTYTYRVRAYNASGLSGASRESKVITPAAPPKPVAPESLSVETVGFSQLDLHWRDRSGNEDGFLIERLAGDSAFVEIARVGANIERFADAHLPFSSQFQYRVSAFNLGGDSRTTEIASAETERFNVSDSTNIALGKTVAASNKGRKEHLRELAVDGLSNTYWSIRDPRPGEWLYVDLDSPLPVDGVLLRWSSKSFATVYDLQISDDAQTWTTLYSAHQETGGEHVILFPRKPTRYVRVFMLEYNKRKVSVKELEVYTNAPLEFDRVGTSGKTVMHAPGASKSLQSDHSFVTKRERPSNDLPLSQQQNNLAKDKPVWFSVDLERVEKIAQVLVKWKGDGYASSYALEISEDGEHWTTIEKVTKESNGDKTFELNGKSARYVRLFMAAAKKSTYKLLELEVFGEKTH